MSRISIQRHAPHHQFTYCTARLGSGHARRFNICCDIVPPWRIIKITALAWLRLNSSWVSCDFLMCRSLLVCLNTWESFICERWYLNEKSEKEWSPSSSPSPLGIKNMHFECLSLSGEGEPISSVTRNIFIADGIFVINDSMHFVKRRLLVRPPNRQHTIMYVKNKYSEACSSSSEVCNGIPRTACLAKNLKRLATMIMLFRLVC